MYYSLKKDRKGQAKYVFVYYYDDENGTPKQVPRIETKHLDGQSEDNINFFLKDYAQRKGLRSDPIPRNETINPKFKKLVNDYVAYLESRGKDHKTIKYHRTMLTRHVIPFFLNESQDNANPNHWVKHSHKMLTALRGKVDSKGKPVTDNTIRICNIALRQFWKWLCEEGKVLNGNDIRVRNPLGISRKRTPLKYSLTPQMVLDFAKAPTTDKRAKLIALVGYFFSLRPQEVFALSRKYFKAGSKISHLECVKVMKKSQLGHKLAYYVKEQQDEIGTEKDPKLNSVGWVCCFDDEAAKLIVELLPKFPSLGDIFSSNGDYIYKYWRKNGIQKDGKKITMKDLRRASLYWLGHHSSLSSTSIQNHARHADFESTQKYLRRPDEGMIEEVDELDLDA